MTKKANAYQPARKNKLAGKYRCKIDGKIIELYFPVLYFALPNRVEVIKMQPDFSKRSPKPLEITFKNNKITITGSYRITPLVEQGFDDYFMRFSKQTEKIKVANFHCPTIRYLLGKILNFTCSNRNSYFLFYKVEGHLPTSNSTNEILSIDNPKAILYTSLNPSKTLRTKTLSANAVLRAASEVFKTSKYRLDFDVVVEFAKLEVILLREVLEIFAESFARSVGIRMENKISSVIKRKIQQK